MFAREIEKFVETTDSGRKKHPTPATIQNIPPFLGEKPPISAQTTPGTNQKAPPTARLSCGRSRLFRYLSSVKDVHNIGKTAVVILLDGGCGLPGRSGCPTGAG